MDHPPSPTERWSQRYAEGHTPWDLGAAHPELAARIRTREEDLLPPFEGARALVPGCGRAHDALALAQIGWEVHALDLVADLAPLVRPRLERHGGSFHVVDALGFHAEPRFQLVFDHTFFCALPLPRRPAYGAAAARWLAPGGRLCAVVFPIGREASLGPPWGMTTEDLASALGSAFRLEHEDPIHSSPPGRAWPERWAVFTRLP